MISVFKENKKVILFLAKFFATYFILFAIYSNFLQENQLTEPYFQNDPITKEVAKESVTVLNWLGFKDVSFIQNTEELSLPIWLEDRYVGKVVEGCNSVSLLILFTAFIIAFSGSFTNTILFLIFGNIVIWCMNVFRIAVLCMLLKNYPEQEAFWHKLMFPAIIYGTVFLLWVLWVNRFSNYKK